MLLSKVERERIAHTGNASLFRRWRRPTVRQGGTLRTAIGVLAVDGVRTITAEAISDADAIAAGHASAAALLGALSRSPAGELYRVDLRLAGDDPRVRLRADADLDEAAIAALKARLARLDARGAWTLATLRLIGSAPGRRAEELAAVLGADRAPFKRRVRQLKELGLTESLDVGYRLSPRGTALMERLDA